MRISSTMVGGRETRQAYLETGDVEELTTRLVRQGARELAAQYAFWIKPVNRGGRQVTGKNQKLEARIREDVERVFKVAEESEDAWAVFNLIAEANPKLKGYAYRLARQGKGEELRKLAVRAGVPRGIDEGIYRLLRTGTGQIGRNVRAQSLVTKGARERLVAKQAKRIGLAKASWWQAAQSISSGRLRITLESGSSVERFAKEVKRAGRGVDAGGGDVVPGILANARVFSRLDYIDAAFAPGGRLRAQERAADKLDEDAGKALQAMERRANRMLRAA